FIWLGPFAMAIIEGASTTIACAFKSEGSKVQTSAARAANRMIRRASFAAIFFVSFPSIPISSGPAFASSEIRRCRLVFASIHNGPTAGRTYLGLERYWVLQSLRTGQLPIRKTEADHAASNQRFSVAGVAKSTTPAYGSNLLDFKI